VKHACSHTLEPYSELDSLVNGYITTVDVYGYYHDIHRNSSE
jgi:hypothetical protein